MDESAPNYSISFRIQRTTAEFAFVNVPVTSDLMIEQPDGTAQIDVPKMVQRAIEFGEGADITWEIEERSYQPHPVQTPPPGPEDASNSTRRGD